MLSTNNKTKHHIWEQFHSSMTTNNFNPSFKIVNEWETKQVNHLHFKYNNLGWFLCLVAFLFHFWMHLLVTKCQPDWVTTCLLKKHFLSYLAFYAKNKSSNLQQIFTCNYWFYKFMSEWFFPNLIISVLSPGLQSSRSSHCIAGVKFIENKQSTTLFYFKTKHTFLQ